VDTRLAAARLGTACCPRGAPRRVSPGPAGMLVTLVAIADTMLRAAVRCSMVTPSGWAASGPGRPAAGASCGPVARMKHFGCGDRCHRGEPASGRKSPFGPGVMWMSWPGSRIVIWCHTPFGTTTASPAPRSTKRSPSASSRVTVTAPETK